MIDTYKRNQQVRAVSGPNAGQGGLVICSFRNWLTVLRDDGTAFEIPASNCRPEPVEVESETN